MFPPTNKWHISAVSVIPGEHNDNKEEKEHESPTQKIKISKFSHGSRVTKFRP